VPELGPDALALLQYTSGSTGEPKGVMVTYENLLANISMTRRQGGTGPDDIVIGWLPHFHDMGLIGMLCHLLFLRGTTVHMSPITFLRRPVRWLQAARRYLLINPETALVRRTGALISITRPGSCSGGF
jgi:acyl-CoA synthetase (AMP-forming)/AMP-acid ligase II